MLNGNSEKCLDQKWENIIKASFFYSDSIDRFQILNTKEPTHQRLSHLYESVQDSQSAIFTDEELTEVFLFAEVKAEQVQNVCKFGIECGNLLYSQIGIISKGVCLSRCADLLDEVNWDPGHVGVVVVFKCSLEIENDKIRVIYPSPGYDAHISWNWRLYEPFQKTQSVEKSSFSHYELYYSSQYFLYQQNGYNGAFKKFPRNVLPVGIVEFKYLPSSQPKINRIQLKPLAKVWEGEFKSDNMTSSISVCITSFKRAVIPFAFEQISVISESMTDFISEYFPGGEIKSPTFRMAGGEIQPSSFDIDYFQMYSVADEESFTSDIARMKKDMVVGKHTFKLDEVMMVVLPSCSLTKALEDSKYSFDPIRHLHCFIIFKRPSSSKDRLNNLLNWTPKAKIRKSVEEVTLVDTMETETAAVGEMENEASIVGEIKKASEVNELEKETPIVGEIEKETSLVNEMEKETPIVDEVEKETSLVNEKKKETPIVGEIEKETSAIDEMEKEKSVIDVEENSPFRLYWSPSTSDDEDDMKINVKEEDETLLKCESLVSNSEGTCINTEAEYQEIQPKYLMCNSSEPENDDFEMLTVSSVPYSKASTIELYFQGKYTKLETEEDLEAALKISLVRHQGTWQTKNGVNSTEALDEGSNSQFLIKKVKGASNKIQKRRRPSLETKSGLISPGEVPSTSSGLSHVLTFSQDALPLKKRKCSSIKDSISSDNPEDQLSLKNNENFRVSKSFQYENSFLSSKDKRLEILEIYKALNSGQNSTVDLPDLSTKTAQQRLQFSKTMNLNVSNNPASTNQARMEETNAVQSQTKLPVMRSDIYQFKALDLTFQGYNTQNMSQVTKDLPHMAKPSFLEKDRIQTVDDQRGVREAGFQTLRNSRISNVVGEFSDSREKSHEANQQNLTISNDLTCAENCLCGLCCVKRKCLICAKTSDQNTQLAKTLTIVSNNSNFSKPNFKVSKNTGKKQRSLLNRSSTQVNGNSLQDNQFGKKIDAKQTKSCAFSGDNLLAKAPEDHRNNVQNVNNLYLSASLNNTSKMNQIIVQQQNSSLQPQNVDIQQRTPQLPTRICQWPTRSPLEPTISPTRPTLSSQGPAPSPQRPTLSLQRPTLSLQRPTLSLQRPTLSLQRPTLSPPRPTLSPPRPTLSSRGPTPSSQRPTPSSQRPTLSPQRSTFAPQLSSLTHQRPPLISQHPSLPLYRPYRPLQQSIILQQHNFNSRQQNTEPQHANSIQQQMHFANSTIFGVPYAAAHLLYRSQTHSSDISPFMSDVNRPTNPFQPFSHIQQNIFQTNNFMPISDSNFSICGSGYPICSSMISPKTPSQQSPHSERLPFSESDLERQIDQTSYSKSNYLDLNSPISPCSSPKSFFPPLPASPPPALPQPPPPMFTMEESVVDDYNVREMDVDNCQEVRDDLQAELSDSDVEVEYLGEVFAGCSSQQEFLYVPSLKRKRGVYSIEKDVEAPIETRHLADGSVQYDEKEENFILDWQNIQSLAGELIEELNNVISASATESYRGSHLFYKSTTDCLLNKTLLKAKQLCKNVGNLKKTYY